MKRSKHLTFPRARHSALTFIGALCLLMAPSVASAQGDCQDFLLLRSPLDLTIDFQAAPVEGNRISWQPESADSTACYTLTGADNLTEFEPTVEGTYKLDSDRDIVFTVVNRGTVGDPTVDLLSVIWKSTSVTEGFLQGSLNLSNSGGVFQIDLNSGVASQANQGIPKSLSRTNVEAIGTWSDGQGSTRLYVVIPGIPVLRSDDGGSSWSVTLSSPNDPILDQLKNPSATGSSIAVDPDNPDRIFVGSTDGLYRSTDAGANFVRIARNISSGKQEISLIRYDKKTGRLFLSINGLGFFESTDNGDNWTLISSLLVPRPTATSPDSAQVALPQVYDVVSSPNDPNLIYVALQNWGVYATTDGGDSWERRDQGMVIGANAQYPSGRKVSVRSLILDSNNPQRLLAASSTRGLFVSNDGGLSWSDSTAFLPQGTNGLVPSLRKIIQNPSNASEFFMTTPESGILHSVDGGQLWTRLYDELTVAPVTLQVGDLIYNPARAGELLLASRGGGIYEEGAPIPLTDTVDVTASDQDLRNADIGLTVRFMIADTADSNGLLRPGDTFTIRAQTFQGYAVWRSVKFVSNSKEPLWELIGLYDLNNPEFCYSTPCDAVNPRIIPGCFADKRANCFNFDDPGGRVSFFDRDIYDGFTYHYAVSTFDYGFTGDVSPRGLDRDMEFSPRSEYESSPQAQNHILPGNYNNTVFTVSKKVSPDLSKIWVVPNPLRRNAGWDETGGSSIHFVNVSLNSKAEIFTLAGDLVTELSNEVVSGEQRGTIVWDTKNSKGREVVSGVYIWRITNAKGGERVGKLTIIR